MGKALEAEVHEPCFQEKHLEREVVPVPQTDTGR